MVWERFLGDERRVKNWVTFFLCIVTGVWAQIISRCNVVRDDATRICVYPFNANYASLFASLLKRFYVSINRWTRWTFLVLIHTDRLYTILRNLHICTYEVILSGESKDLINEPNVVFREMHKYLNDWSNGTSMALRRFPSRAVNSWLGNYYQTFKRDTWKSASHLPPVRWLFFPAC